MDAKNHISPDHRLNEFVKAAATILVLQPDSPDGDSLGTALALEEIFGDLGKQVVLYAYKEPEPYLRVLEGWDRVAQDFPKAFDLTVLVDTGSPSLIKSALDHHAARLTAKPFVVVDHHASQSDFGFEVVRVVEEAVSTSELVMGLALRYDWPVNEAAARKLAYALLADSLGLSTSGTTAKSVAMLSEMTARGANLYELHRERREASALTPEQVALKGALLSAIRYYVDGKIAVAEIPPDVVAANKDRFEPYNMIISEMQWAKGVELAAVFKNYGTKINVPLRSANGLAGPMAEAMGGGGHANAGAYRCETADIAAEEAQLVAAFERLWQQRQETTIEPA